MMDIEVNIPDGVSGQWSVETFEVTKEDAEWFNFGQMMNAFSSNQLGVRDIHPGMYKRLVRKEEPSGERVVVMSNTPAEIRDHMGFIFAARRSRHVLINGLGLGVALSAILKSTVTEEIWVVEKEIDVISLVGPHIKDDRVKIRHADAFTFKPPKSMRFGAVWHDIWDDISDDNLPEMTKLHRRYGQKTDWQGSWCRSECKRLRNY